MSPLREASTWTVRFKEEIKIDPLRRYYLIFEGAHTELKYFEGLDDNRKFLGISSSIELVILHKEGDIEHHSHPKHLLELIDKKKTQLKNDGKYDKEIDRFVIVFDRDRHMTVTPEQFLEFVELASKENILGLTNPCFELWLILHFENTFDEIILNNQREFLENIKVSNSHTYTSKVFSEISGMNSKSNLDFEKLKNGVKIAIVQEMKLPQKNGEIAHKIGSNIGVLIQEMKQDPRNQFIK